MTLGNGWSVSVVFRKSGRSGAKRYYVAAIENGAAALRAVKAVVKDLGDATLEQQVSQELLELRNFLPAW